MSCDMCFGVRGKTFVNQMEMALGILPGGTGTQRYPRLIGRNRAVEVIMGGALSRDDGLEEISSSPRPRTRMPIRGIRGRRLEYDARREPRHPRRSRE